MAIKGASSDEGFTANETYADSGANAFAPVRGDEKSMNLALSLNPVAGCNRRRKSHRHERLGVVLGLLLRQFMAGVLDQSPMYTGLMIDYKKIPEAAFGRAN